MQAAKRIIRVGLMKMLTECRWRRLLDIAFATLALLLAAPRTAAPALPVDPSRRVLVLYADNASLPANAVFDASFQRALRSQANRSITCYNEYLDEVRFPAGYSERAAALLQAKFGMQPPDIVVAVGSAVYEFCIRYRSRVFDGVPIVFAGIGECIPPDSDSQPAVTSVCSQVDGPGLIRLIHRLHPRARRIYEVGGSAHADSLSAALRAAHLEMVPLREPTSSDLLRALANLPDGSIVLDSSLPGDNDENLLPRQELLAAMSRASRVPLYGCSDPEAGPGIVGTVASPVSGVGTETAACVLEILATPGTELPAPKTLGAVPILDWRELRRWRIWRRQVPAGSIVRFEPPSFWRQHATLVITSTALSLLQTGLIIALVLQSRRRRRAEREAQTRRQELAHMTRVATMGELTASLAHEINQPLAAILSNAQAALRLLANGGANTQEIQEILADIAADDHRAGEVIRRTRALLRKEASEPAILEVNDLVAEVAGLVRGEMILQNISLSLDLSPRPRFVHGDKVQLQQVLLNLMMNAFDAMKDTEMGDRRVLVHTGETQTHAVEIAVEDFGAGVPADKFEKIFEPFVTTKPHGMGLGLSICRSIIVAHGGRIGLVARPGGGARFWFTLPTAEGTKA
jgi:signal transduction histidine kinase